MTKRFKRALFYSAVTVFLVSSYAIVLYAQGYKYSFSENRFFMTGAIYLKTNTSADVFLDDKLLGNTSFFNNSYRLEGLLPGRHAIRVQKADHSTWQKSITVDEGFVSEFSKILLLSESDEELVELKKEISLLFISPAPTASASEPFMLKLGILSTTGEEPEKIDDNVKGFALSEDKNKLAWWTTNEIWVMWLNDANYQPYHKKDDKELITRFSAQIKKAAWFRDDNHLIIDFNLSKRSSRPELGTKAERDKYKIFEIDTRGGINIIEV